MDWGNLLGAGVGALLGGIGGGSKPSGTTTTTNDPWGPVQPYLLDLFSRAQSQANVGGSLTPDQVAAQSELGKFASGERVNPYLGADNPYLQSVIDNANADTMRAIQPMVNRANAASGSFGNSGVAETYGRMAGEAAAKAATTARYQDYTQQMGLNENDLNRRMSAIQPFLGFANYEQSLPWTNLSNYRSNITGSGGSSQSTPYFTNTAGNVLGGALLGSQVGKLWGS